MPGHQLNAALCRGRKDVLKLLRQAGLRGILASCSMDIVFVGSEAVPLYPSLPLQAYNVEREICQVGKLDEEYEIDVCVCSTAPMADRFRCVFRHRCPVLIISAVQGFSSWCPEHCRGLNRIFLAVPNVRLLKQMHARVH